MNAVNAFAKMVQKNPSSLAPAFASIGFDIDNLPDEAVSADGGLMLLPSWITREQLLEALIFMLKHNNVYQSVRKPRNGELNAEQQEHNKMVKMANAFEKEKANAIAKAERQKRDAEEAEAAAAVVQAEIAKTFTDNSNRASKLNSLRIMPTGRGMPSSFQLLPSLPAPSATPLTSAEFRRAALSCHPDKGGSLEDWHQLQVRYERPLMIMWHEGQEAPAAEAPLAAGNKAQIRRARERGAEEKRAEKEKRLRAGAPEGLVVIASSHAYAYIVEEGGILPSTFASTKFSETVVIRAFARLPDEGDAEWIQIGTRVSLPTKEDAGVFICALKVESVITCVVQKSDGSIIKPRLNSVTVFSQANMDNEEIRKLQERGRTEIESLRHQPSPPVKAPDAVRGKLRQKAAAMDEVASDDDSSSPEVTRKKPKAKPPASAIKSKRNSPRTKNAEEAEEEEDEASLVVARKVRKKSKCEEDEERVTLEQAYDLLKRFKDKMEAFLGEK